MGRSVDTHTLHAALQQLVSGGQESKASKLPPSSPGRTSAPRRQQAGAGASTADILIPQSAGAATSHRKVQSSVPAAPPAAPLRPTSRGAKLASQLGEVRHLGESLRLHLMQHRSATLTNNHAVAQRVAPAASRLVSQVARALDRAEAASGSATERSAVHELRVELGRRLGEAMGPALVSPASPVR